MEVKIRTLTPIWTGDIDQTSDLLQFTGIIGSIRWWTEAILRSINKYACDPTSDEKCPEEVKNEKYYCSACLIFGATGMRRAFRLNMNGGKRTFAGRAINIKPSGRNRGWYLGSGIVGEIDLSIIPLNKDFDESLVFVPLILASKWGGIGARTQHGYGVVEMENYPKIDFNGFEEAVRKITDQERLSKLSELLYGSKSKILLRHENSNGFPNLREMFFAKVQFEVTDTDWWKKVDGIAPRSQDNYRGYTNDQRMIDWIKSGSVPISPAIKNWLRYKNGARLWKTGNQNQDRRIENWLFGTTERICSRCYEKVRKDRNNPKNFWCPNCSISLRKEETFERIASKINISCAYMIGDNLWEFRIWGWIPREGLPSGFDRDGFLNSLKKMLNGSGSVKIPWNELLGDQTKDHKLKVWREFDSSRDTVKPNESNINDYLQSLLRGEVE